MVYYSYAAFADMKSELAPTLAEYLSTASAKHACARHAALSLLYALSQRTSLPVSFPIVADTHGRPFFAGEHAPDFNLSHSGNLAAAAIGKTRVGIDLEEHSPARDTKKLAARFFGEREKALLEGAPRELFFELWTKKEALGKYLGDGLVPLLGKDTDELAKAHGVRFFTKKIEQSGKYYTLTVCTKEPITFVEI